LGDDSETNRALRLFRLRLQPDLDQAPDGFGAGLDIVLFDPTVQRFKLSRLEADHAEEFSPE